MTLKNFDFKEDNHFIAMEYYNLILNRTFIVLLTTEYLIGLQGNGMVSVEGGEDMFTKQITRSLAIKGDLMNPYSYLKEKYIREIENENLLGDSFLKLNKNNFKISKKDIKKVFYEPKKKWGMGNYPHDGRIYIETISGKKKELIILGDQSGEKIALWMMTK
ncbi:MAG: hypothetical protein EOO47_12905 [Flavobacterium sp.]|nr:MAG: hypothetical protein EOO47_12905 [Flavobacterium sp.]